MFGRLTAMDKQGEVCVSLGWAPPQQTMTSQLSKGSGSDIASTRYIFD